MSPLETLAEAFRGLPIRDLQEPGGELDNLRLREAARAALQCLIRMAEELGEERAAVFLMAMMGEE